ncbi:MAG TPA: DUF2442 domain-containing protein [Phycisphaerales bacterium]|nr:DUF2442 domain-containing protein [Phycisphaerales bacterium]
MAPDVVSVRPAGGTCLDLTFADGSERRVDIALLARPEGVFKDLHRPEFVASATVNPDIGTICWSTGADLSPDVLFKAGKLLKQGTSAA